MQALNYQGFSVTELGFYINFNEVLICRGIVAVDMVAIQYALMTTTIFNYPRDEFKAVLKQVREQQGQLTPSCNK